MAEDLLSYSKIISIEEFAILREKFRKEGKKVIHCHGVFDLLHPGHIAHLEEAKGLGDILVASVTSSSYVNKGPGRPFFSDELRMKSLAALECVNYVILSKDSTPLKIFEFIQPDLYVKGKEYEKPEDDITQNISREAERVKFYGGSIYFTDKITFSSTKLLNENFPVFSPDVKDYLRSLSSEYSLQDITKMVDNLRNIKVMVIGDIIIDEYVFCNVQGLVSKDRALSARHIKAEQYLGGALAVARHLASFVDNITVCSMIGTEPSGIYKTIIDNLNGSIQLDLLSDPNYCTAVKRRYIEKQSL